MASFQGLTEIMGYVHQVSPLKSSGKTRYFDCTIQTTEKAQTRAICFYPDYHPKFKEMNLKKQPVKLTNFKISKKFGRDDVVIDRNTNISEASKQTFKPLKLEVKEYVNINSIPSLVNNHLISVKGKLCQLSGTKMQATGAHGVLKRQNGYLVDPTGSIKVVLWERFCDTVEQDKTYIFRNVTVKQTSYGETYINTTRTGSSIDETGEFKGNLAIPEDPPEMAVETLKAKIIGVLTVSKYPVCAFCSTKLPPLTNKSLAQCLSCKLYQDPDSCTTHWFFKGLFKATSDTNQQPIQLSVFNQQIVKISLFANMKNINTLSEEEFIKLFLGLKELEVTYDALRKVLTDVQLATSASSTNAQQKQAKA